MEQELQHINKKDRYELRQEEKRKAAQTFQRERTVKRFALWGGVVVILIGGVFGMIKLGSSSPQGKTALLADVVAPSDWAKGREDARATLVEYSDFQCPACGAYYPLVKRINDELGDDVRFAYRHFPLPQHKNAKPAAYAAEAAGRQGKFWEMHDKIFEGQDNWSESPRAEEIFIQYATDLGLDIERFKTDVGSDEIRAKVENDYSSGVRSQVNATPTFFLNGKRIQPRSYDDFKDIITKEISNRS